MIAPALARRIDRLSRHAHRPHRYAHHPLCDAYAGEIVRVGKMKLCRGCAATAAGLAAGGVGGAALSSLAGAANGATLVFTTSTLIAFAFVLLLLIGFVGLADWRGKFFKRFVPAALFAGVLLAAALHPALPLLVAASVAVVAAFSWSASYRRRGPNRAACKGCPHRNEVCCPGFAPIVRRERAFSRLSARWLDAEGRWIEAEGRWIEAEGR